MQNSIAQLAVVLSSQKDGRLGCFGYVVGPILLLVIVSYWAGAARRGYRAVVPPATPDNETDTPSPVEVSPQAAGQDVTSRVEVEPGIIEVSATNTPFLDDLEARGARATPEEVAEIQDEAQDLLRRDDSGKVDPESVKELATKVLDKDWMGAWVRGNLERGEREALVANRERVLKGVPEGLHWMRSPVQPEEECEVFYAIRGNLDRSALPVDVPVAYIRLHWLDDGTWEYGWGSGWDLEQHAPTLTQAMLIAKESLSHELQVRERAPVEIWQLIGLTDIER